MKKMTNVEVNVINLSANDILCSSPVFGSNTINNASAIGVNSRDYYEDEEEIW